MKVRTYWVLLVTGITPAMESVNPIPHGVLESVGPPYQNLFVGLFHPVSFYESIDIYYRTYNPKGQVSFLKMTVTTNA